MLSRPKPPQRSGDEFEAVLRSLDDPVEPTASSSLSVLSGGSVSPESPKSLPSRLFGSLLRRLSSPSPKRTSPASPKPRSPVSPLSARLASLLTPTKPQAKRTCNVCLADFAESRFPAATPACQHAPATCAGCVTAWITASLNGPTPAHIKCPNAYCGEPVLPDDVARLSPAAAALQRSVASSPRYFGVRR
jgi:hypothetical protein